MKYFNLFGMIKIAINDRLKYKFNFLMTFLSTLLYSFLYFMLWSALYRFKPDQVMSYKKLITYIMVAQACNFIRWSPAERLPVYDTARRIQTGDIAIDLLRPVDLQWQKFAEAAGFFIVEFLLVNIPLFLFFIFFFHISLPTTIFSMLAFFLSLVIAFLTFFMLNQIVIMLTFWTYNAQGLQITKKAVCDLLAGTLISFQFFPNWLRTTADHLPFKAITYIPVSIYTGKIPNDKIPFIFTEQIFWCMIMFIISRLVYLKLVKRLTVFGG